MHLKWFTKMRHQDASYPVVLQKHDTLACDLLPEDITPPLRKNRAKWIQQIIEVSHTIYMPPIQQFNCSQHIIKGTHKSHKMNDRRFGATVWLFINTSQCYYSILHVQHDTQYPFGCILSLHERFKELSIWPFLPWMVTNSKSTHPTECSFKNKLQHLWQKQKPANYFYLQRVLHSPISARRTWLSASTSTHLLQQFHCHWYCKWHHLKTMIKINRNALFYWVLILLRKKLKSTGILVQKTSSTTPATTTLQCIINRCAHFLYTLFVLHHFCLELWGLLWKGSWPILSLQQGNKIRLQILSLCWYIMQWTSMMMTMLIPLQKKILQLLYHK